MLALDFQPLTITHLLLLGAGFAASYGIIWWLLRQPRRYLAPVPHKSRTYYAGSVVIIVTVCLALPVLGASGLWGGLLGVGCLVAIVGARDQIMGLSPGRQFLWQILIATVATFGGWSIKEIGNPVFGGVINLAWQEFGAFIWPGSLLAILWLLLLMNAINWLDGADGLASGVGLAALLTLAAVSLLPSVQDPQTLALALIGAGSFAGFIIWNAPPARVYLGTSGSWFLGLLIGLVAIVGGGKIVTTLLVLALPVIDFLSVIGQRLLVRQAPWEGGPRQHLHWRLRQRGVSAQNIMVAGTAISLAFGWLALELQTNTKIAALLLAALVIIMITIGLASFSANVRSK